MVKAYVWTQARLDQLAQALSGRFEDERGAETVEMVGLAAAVAALLGVVVTAMGGGAGQGIADAIVQKITEFIEAF